MISNQKKVFDITIRDPNLTTVSTVKFLAVTSDEDFTFNDNVIRVTTKISKSVGIMGRLHCQLPGDVTVKLNYSLVYSHLTYATLAGEDRDVLMLLRLGVFTGKHANYSQIITKRFSLFTQFMITLLY